MSGPLIVQSDRTVLLEVAHPDVEACRHAIALFAELERAPEHIHTYRITPLGLWNARAAGHDADDMPSPPSTASPGSPCRRRCSIDIRETVGRYGRLVHRGASTTALVLRGARSPPCSPRSSARKRIAPLLAGQRRARRVSRACLGARAAQAGAAQGRLAGARTSPAYADGTPLADRARPRRTVRRCAPTSARRSTPSAAPAARASSCCPAAPARRSSAPARWPRAEDARRSILVTNTVAARQWRASCSRGRR